MGENRIIGLTYQKALEEASYDPDLVWEPWTVRFNQAAFLLAWLGIFAGAGMTSAYSGIIDHRFWKSLTTSKQ